eukprot:Sspe_Gene.55287::Locus_30417_Transcript_1_1_Confidence_1.000_Length_1306::g.55287::m.55287
MRCRLCQQDLRCGVEGSFIYVNNATNYPAAPAPSTSSEDLHVKMLEGRRMRAIAHGERPLTGNLCLVCFTELEKVLESSAPPSYEELKKFMVEEEEEEETDEEALEEELKALSLDLLNVTGETALLQQKRAYVMEEEESLKKQLGVWCRELWSLEVDEAVWKDECEADKAYHRYIAAMTNTPPRGLGSFFRIVVPPHAFKHSPFDPPSINGLRIGLPDVLMPNWQSALASYVKKRRPPPTPITTDWDEVNAALGWLTLLLATLVKLLGITPPVDLIPQGSTSKVVVMQGNTPSTYNLFGAPGCSTSSVDVALTRLNDVVTDIAQALDVYLIKFSNNRLLLAEGGNLWWQRDMRMFMQNVAMITDAFPSEGFHRGLPGKG